MASRIAGTGDGPARRSGGGRGRAGAGRLALTRDERTTESLQVVRTSVQAGLLALPVPSGRSLVVLPARIETAGGNDVAVAHVLDRLRQVGVAATKLIEELAVAAQAMVCG